MIKDFRTYINEGLFDRNTSEFIIARDESGAVYEYVRPKTKEELISAINDIIEKSDTAYPDLSSIDVSRMEINGDYSPFEHLFDKINNKHLKREIFPDISSWEFNVDFGNSSILSSVFNSMFANNKLIGDFVIPDNIRVLSKKMFECSSISSVTFPSKCEFVYNYCFAECSKLKTVNFNSNLVSIGTYVFEECISLEEIVFPENLQFISNHSFTGCKNLKHVKFNSRINKIYQYAFENCESLTELDIPDNVSFLGDCAFLNCTNLSKVNIPLSCRELNSHLFCGCTSLTHIKLHSEIHTINVSAFLKSGVKLITYSGTKEQFKCIEFENTSMYSEPKSSDFNKITVIASDDTFTIGQARWGYYYTLDEHNQNGLTENQEEIIVNMLIEEGLVKDTIFEGCKSMSDYIRRIRNLILVGGCSASLILAAIVGNKNFSRQEKDELRQEVVYQMQVRSNNAVNFEYTDNIEKVSDLKDSDWKLISDDTEVTVYNATRNQCNDDIHHTASMFKLDLKKPESHKIIAMERSMMKEYGLRYGDLIKIEGTYRGRQDGVYQIQDTMNKRFVGKHKIDVLVDNDLHYGGTSGTGRKAKIYVLKDKSKTDTLRADVSHFAPEKN